MGQSTLRIAVNSVSRGCDSRCTHRQCDCYRRRGHARHYSLPPSEPPRRPPRSVGGKRGNGAGCVSCLAWAVEEASLATSLDTSLSFFPPDGLAPFFPFFPFLPSDALAAFRPRPCAGARATPARLGNPTRRKALMCASLWRMKECAKRARERARGRQ